MRRRFNRRLDMETRFERARRRNMVDARPGIHECIVILDGLKPDFNIGKIFRTADAFSVREIHLVGVGIFDPEPAKGSVRWVQYVFHDDFASCHDQIRRQGYTFFALEPGGTEVLGKGGLPEKSAFILGHEEFGLSFNPDDYPDIHPLTIPQWGHVQSLNVSVAASIVLYEYIRQHGRPLSEGLVQHPGGDTRRGGKNG
ncbi:hypothetical protein GF1_15870 [Desulfolithobacter dissulfuricans]|uniref:tRNA/rRNA methyltransferase SpoU type domain-containing protein n=1 Tax=Desulfolithobacter dissulfuricans TaxID=2795293 RepID=A0A915U0G6_9BACT|nr:TrmH family RNA methyltransferase [Desulfolithobacter dissulfuricans]BCO09211.1 hypothetical protein GF1_15870 [Desulfolithobacter dissulfuricans]